MSISPSPLYGRQVTLFVLSLNGTATLSKIMTMRITSSNIVSPPSSILVLAQGDGCP